MNFVQIHLEVRNILRELEKQEPDADFFTNAPFADMLDCRMMVKLLLLLRENFSQDGGKAIIQGVHNITTQVCQNLRRFRLGVSFYFLFFFIFIFSTADKLCYYQSLLVA